MIMIMIMSSARACMRPSALESYVYSDSGIASFSDCMCNRSYK